jgi:ectoine hydroxylase-related dioxygenase (phytanoyl-CoA dioxygenase family)
MNTDLTHEQIDAYRRDGYVAQRNFLSPDEVATLKAAVLEAAAGTGKGKDKVDGAGRSLNSNKNDYYSKVFTQRLNLWRLNDTVKKFMLNSGIGKMLCDLEGVDGFRVWHDQALIKEPYGNPTAWHLDNPYWSFYSRHAVSIWIALEPATLENGCMWFVPGSQEKARYDNVAIGQHLAGLFDVYPEMTDTDPVAVPMQPGDCSFHNGLSAHGAGANMTRQRRIAMTCAYMPVGSTFNGQQNILPKEYFDSLKKGDVLKNDDWNPVVYADG